MFNLCYSLCTAYERKAFFNGFHYGTQMMKELVDGDAHSILEMLFTYYYECNNTDTDAVKAAFDGLYQRMHGIPGSWMPSAPSAKSMRKLNSRKRVKVGLMVKSEVQTIYNTEAPLG